MKKLLLVLAVASFAVACNNSGEKKATTDSPAVTTPDTAAPKMADTSVHSTDTTASKMDSTAK